MKKIFLYVCLTAAMFCFGKEKTPPPAKCVIEIWVWGGPSQLETFDPKPNAPVEYNKKPKKYVPKKIGDESKAKTKNSRGKRYVR